MRGCPWQCRFCQSTVIKRPLRVRSVETIVQAAVEAYRNTGCDEISLLSLSSSDYPYFEELVTKMAAIFAPLGVNVSFPSLRVNSQLRTLPSLVRGVRKGGLTLAPEVARDDMREQIRKKIKNEDLYEGCRNAFRHGWRKVKLYFLCGLPGNGSQIWTASWRWLKPSAKFPGRKPAGSGPLLPAFPILSPSPIRPTSGRVCRPGNILPRCAGTCFPDCGSPGWKSSSMMWKPACWKVSSRGEIVVWARWFGWLGRVGPGWMDGANFQAGLWWKAFKDAGVDPLFYSQRERGHGEVLPWDHIETKRDRPFLEGEHSKSRVQLQLMAESD